MWQVALNNQENKNIEITVIIPATNEAMNIERAVLSTISTIKNISQSFEMLVAEDGSTDDTDIIAKKLEKDIPLVRHIHNKKRLGKGGAIVNALKVSCGEIIVIMDADLSANLRHLKELVDSIRNDGYHIAIGSRMFQDSEVIRHKSRDISSKIYNYTVRFIFQSVIRDHQCGFKAFRRDALTDLLKNTKEQGWFWDTEILIKAQIRGYKIREIPIKWRERNFGESKFRLLIDYTIMFTKLFKLWFKFKLN